VAHDNWILSPSSYRTSSFIQLNLNQRSEDELACIPHHQHPLYVKVTLSIPVQINQERIKSPFYAIF